MTLGVQQDERARGVEIVNELARSFKVRRLYDPGHPQRSESEETSSARIAAVLEETGPIELAVESERMLVDGESVFDQPEGRDSIAFLLYREGLRQLSIYPGLTGEELGTFLDEIAAASLAGPENELDLVARLWERNFVHIRYAFVEQLMDQDWTPPAAEEPPVEPDDKPVVLLDEDKRAGDFLREVDPTLYFLDDEDMATLQRELEAEKERTLIHETLTCLREILLVQDAGDPTTLLTAIADIHASFLEEGAYEDVVGLHEVFEPYLARSADEEGRSFFAELRERALDAGALQRLAARLDADSIPDEVAVRYYRGFGSGRFAALIARCGDLKRLCQRPLIARTLVELAQDDPAALRAAIVDQDPAVACPAAYLAGLVAQPILLEPLALALEAPEAQVRREALLAVKQIGGGRALDIVARAVDDPDPTVRLYALRHLILRRYAPALSRVRSLVDRGGEGSLTERRLLYEAYGALGGDAVVDELARRMRRRGGLLRKADPEEVACVLTGLAAVGTRAARALVEEAAAARHPLVQRAASELLAGWNRARTADR